MSKTEIYNCGKEDFWPYKKMMLYCVLQALEDCHSSTSDDRHDACDFIYSNRLEYWLEAMDIENYRLCGKIPIVDAIRSACDDKRKVDRMIKVFREQMGE